MIREVTYTSVFDDSITCVSKAKYDDVERRVFDIEDAENAEDADDANGLTDEYITVDGHRLSEHDGLTFDY